MKKKKGIFYTIIIIAAIAITGLYTATGYSMMNLTLSNINLRMEILEDFEDTSQHPQGWKVSPSRMGKAEKKYIKGGPAILSLREGETKEHALGVKCKFNWPGYNWVRLEPPKEKEFKGMIKNLSIWVCGRNNKWFLEAWLKDWRGDTHIVKWGSIKFFGWKRLTTIIPASIPQAVDSYPPQKQLKLTALYLRADPTEPVFESDVTVKEKTDSGNTDTANEKGSEYWYYVYLDHLTYITELPDMEFDGKTLETW